MTRMRKSLLLAGCILLLHGALLPFATPTGADEDGLAALFYWRLPLGAPTAQGDEPSYGFRLDQSYERRFMQLSRGDSDDAPLFAPALDVRLAESGVQSLGVAGVDLLPAFSDRLNVHGGEGGEQFNILEWAALILAGAAAGVAICEFGFDCISGDDDGSSGDNGTGTD